MQFQKKFPKLQKMFFELQKSFPELQKKFLRFEKNFLKVHKGLPESKKTFRASSPRNRYRPAAVDSVAVNRVDICPTGENPAVVCAVPQLCVKVAGGDFPAENLSPA